jgi:hypothetical protein
MSTLHVPKTALLFTLLIAIVGEAYGMDEPRKVPDIVLAAKRVYVYLQEPSSSQADKEYLKLAKDWVKGFFSRAEVAGSLTLVDQYEEADIVLFVQRELQVSTFGIPSGATTVAMSDGSIIGSHCYERSDGSLDCDTYEGHLNSSFQWGLRALRARDFGKGYSLLPPEADRDPVPNPLAVPLLRIDERQVRVGLCVHGYSAPIARRFELEIGCEVLEFWNQLQLSRNKPELRSVEVFDPREQIIPNTPFPARKTDRE